MTERTFAGKRIPTIDSEAQACGEARYTTDMTLPKMFHERFSAGPRQTLKYRHPRGAKTPRGEGRHHGTGHSWPEVGGFRYTRDQQLLPVGKVRYVGEEVAAVAPDSEEIEQEALALIKVQYEVLPAVFTLEEAMADGAPLIHEGFQRNINIHAPIEAGDVEAKFRRARLIREDTFVSEQQSCFMGEAYAILAHYHASGNLEVWMPSASPHSKAKALSNLHQTALTKVHVHQTIMGGRSDVFAGESIAAPLSMQAGRPVKIVCTRRENTMATG